MEVELTGKTEARVSAVLRQLLETYDDVVYRVAPGAATVVKRAAAGLEHGAERIFVKPYPPPVPAGVAQVFVRFGPVRDERPWTAGGR